MPRAFLLALGLLLSGPAAADTLLHLTETARVLVHPDQLVGVLRAEASAASAAQAQAQVNEAMAAAVTLAHQSKAVTVATGAYTVWPQPRDLAHPAGRQDWHASQSLTLKSGDGDGLLALVGTLQQKGLAVSQLGWQVAGETARKARDEALKQALGAVRGRAEEVAGILGLHFDGLREVRLGTTQQPVPMLRAMAGNYGAAPPGPVAEAQDLPVEASVEADAVLK